MIGGFGIACIISVPNWPFWNKHPVGWFRAIDPEKEAKHFEKIQKKKDKKDKKGKKKKNKSKKGGEDGDDETRKDK